MYLAGDYCTIGRIPIKVESDSASLLGRVQTILCPCPGGPNGQTFHLRLRYGCSEPAELLTDGALRLSWSGTLRDGMPCECYSADGRRLMRLPGRAWGYLDAQRRTLEIVCRPGQEACLYDGCLGPLLCDLLACHGCHVIHAASLAFERKGELAGVLLAGKSGAGKTTTALALASAGMTLLADDASFIESGGQNDLRVRLWGWRLSCKVHEDTRRLLPWLQGCPAQPARTEGETLVDPTQVIGPSNGVVAYPRLLLLLGPRCDGAHVLEPLDKVRATATLASENIRVHERHAGGVAGDAFRAIGRLVAQCDVYRLRVGGQIMTLAQRVRGLLERTA